MQSRLASTAAKFNRIVQSGCQKQFPTRSLGSGTTTGRTADPEQESTGKDAEPYVHSRSGSKLESPGVGPLTNPIAQQKRRNHNYSTAKLDGVSCVGLDGSPWPENEDKVDIKKQREEQAKDNREYFKDHKASPLSEIKLAETRKQVTKANDGGTKNYVKVIDGSMVQLWSPEQMDTVDDSLRRAMEIYRRNAERGDPDSPHGRVLRQLRGEYW